MTCPVSYELALVGENGALIMFWEHQITPAAH